MTRRHERGNDIRRNGALQALQTEPARGRPDTRSSILSRFGLRDDRFINPISLTVVLSVQFGLVVTGDQRLLRVFRRALDGFACRIDENIRLAPTHALAPVARGRLRKDPGAFVGRAGDDGPEVLTDPRFKQNRRRAFFNPPFDFFPRVFRIVLIAAKVILSPHFSPFPIVFRRAHLLFSIPPLGLPRHLPRGRLRRPGMER